LPADYLPLLIFFLFSSFIATVSLALPHYLGPLRPNKAKSEVVESGKLAYGDAHRRVPIQYYMTAMLFILFDIEVLFFYPWAVLFWELKWYGMGIMGLFTLLLILGFAYEWKKGGMEWE
jgi:NADH-quinone oxidoreductase subunit A